MNTAKRFNFHGSFLRKKDAIAREQSIPDAFIIDKHGRHYVVTEKTNYKKNAKNLTVIYGRVIACQAQKTGPHFNCDAECKSTGHRYNHDFKSRVKLLGIPDGSFLMLSDGTTIKLSDGSMLMSDREY